MDQNQQEGREESLLAKWLNKLQEESWNLELLISGFSIFGLFQILQSLELKVYKFTALFEKGDIIFMVFSNLSYLIYIGLIIFIVCLLVHVFLRGLWIGAIGLRFVSGSINYDGFKYNDRFKSYLERKVGDFDDFILRLERISSSIFSMTYLLFFIMLSFMIYLILVGLFGYLLIYIFGESIISSVYYVVLYFILGIGFIVAFDFLTLGLLKRIKARWFTAIYFPIYIFVSTVTLSFLWRPLLYNFIDQKHTKWMAAIMVPFLLFLYIFLISYHNSYLLYPWKNTREDGIFSSINYKENSRYTLDPEFYDDLRSLERENSNYAVIQVMSIPKYKLNSSIMEVFVKYDKNTENVLLAIDSTITPINEAGLNLYTWNRSQFAKQREERRKKMEEGTGQDSKLIISAREEFVKNEQKLYRENLQKLVATLKVAYAFDVNGSSIPKDSMDILFYTHPNFGEKGFICNFSISTKVKEGTNYLTLRKKFIRSGPEKYQELDFTIPFVYSRSY